MATAGWEGPRPPDLKPLPALWLRARSEPGLSGPLWLQTHFKITDQLNERWQSDWILAAFWHVLAFMLLVCMLHPLGAIPKCNQVWAHPPATLRCTSLLPPDALCRLLLSLPFPTLLPCRGGGTNPWVRLVCLFPRRYAYSDDAPDDEEDAPSAAEEKAAPAGEESAAEEETEEAKLA